MRFNKEYLQFLIIGILIALIISCEGKKSELELKTETDINSRFSIDIPSNWHIEKSNTGFSSTIFFADSTKLLENVVVYDIVWDSTKIYLNDHFRRSMDSIVLANKQQILNQKFDSLNGFKTYRFEAVEFDTLNNVQLIKNYTYIEDFEKNGHLIFTYSRIKKELSKADLTLTERIMKTIKRK